MEADVPTVYADIIHAKNILPIWWITRHLPAFLHHFVHDCPQPYSFQCLGSSRQLARDAFCTLGDFTVSVSNEKRERGGGFKLFIRVTMRVKIHHRYIKKKRKLSINNGWMGPSVQPSPFSPYVVIPAAVVSPYIGLLCCYSSTKSSLATTER